MSNYNQAYPTLKLQNENDYFEFVATANKGPQDVRQGNYGSGLRLTFTIGQNSLNIPVGSKYGFFMNGDFANLIRDNKYQIIQGQQYRIIYCGNKLYAIINLTLQDKDYTSAYSTDSGFNQNATPVQQAPAYQPTPATAPTVTAPVVAPVPTQPAPTTSVSTGYTSPTVTEPKNDFEKDVMMDAPISDPAAYKAALLAFANEKDHMDVCRIISAKIDTDVKNAMIGAKEILPDDTSPGVALAQTFIARMILDTMTGINIQLVKKGLNPLTYISETVVDEVEVEQKIQQDEVKTHTN